MRNSNTGGVMNCRSTLEYNITNYDVFEKKTKIKYNRL